MYLLDTNAISELRKYLKGNADSGFTNWVFPIKKNELFINEIIYLKCKKAIY